jgi:electron transfer flavoprotein alpha subunit
MVGKILVLLDHKNGQVLDISRECVGLAQKLSKHTGAAVSALLMGDQVRPLASAFERCGLESIILVEDERLGIYTFELHLEAFTQILGTESPDLVLMGHTYQNLDLAPRAAARLNTSLVTDCIDYKLDEDQLLFVRQMFRGKLNADVRVSSDYPWFVTVQGGAFSATDVLPGDAAILTREVSLSSVQPQVQVLERVQINKGAVDLAKADCIIGVGRGVKRLEDMKVVEELAGVLSAELGASRPVVDNEWLDRSRQIGSSGQNVSPKLYLALGISGAIQHVVGIKNSECIVAVNSDPNAPIFNVATYGIVGDLLEITPALTQKIKAIRGL